MDEPARRTPVYRQVHHDEPNRSPQPQPVMFTINDGLHSYAPLTEDLGGDAPQAPPGEGEFDYIGKVMFALRGRWWLAIVLALIGGAAGAYVGYHFKPVTYRSEGVISVAYTRP